MRKHHSFIHPYHALIVPSFLAFIGVSQEPKFQQEKALVDFNIQTFQDSLLQVLERS